MSDEVTPPADDRDPTAEQEGSDRPTPANPAHPVHPYPPGGTPGGPPRRIRNGFAELPPLPPGLVIPDDLSELDDEVRAFRKEWRTAHPARWRRVLLPPWLGKQRHNLPLLLLGLPVFSTFMKLSRTASCRNGFRETKRLLQR